MIFGKVPDTCVVCQGQTTSGFRRVVAEGYIHNSGKCFELWRKGFRPLKPREEAKA